MATIAAQRLTAEQFGMRPDPGHPEELVRGTIVAMPPPKPRHGQICGEVYFVVRQAAAEHNLGHVVCNDSGVITERDPDTVRGADIAFYSYARVPRGPLPDGYLPVPPDVVFEVRSPSDRDPEVLEEVAEYLNAGVGAVVVLDPEARSAHVHIAGRDVVVLGPGDELALPEWLGPFRVVVGRLFT
jgi:Uma2 family endonuclease